MLPHLKVYDAACLAYRQGSTRRGSYAAFLDVSHPDIVQFIEMRKPTGDQNMKALNLHHGVNIPDAFMEKIEASMRDADADDTWELKHPTTGEVVERVSARDLWQRILEMRMHTGEPYLIFTDTANRALPSWLKDKGLSIHGSNLCTEIFLPTSPERTAVCCLSSVNLEHYDEWKNDPQFIPDAMEFLDNVLQYFIDHAPDQIRRARYCAMRERSVGLGAMGFHAYLQKHGIPFESALAKSINIQIFRRMREACAQADAKLCAERGACPDAADSGVARRFSHWMSVAPNASSSPIMGGTSPSIEPYRANIYRQDSGSTPTPSGPTSSPTTAPCSTVRTSPRTCATSSRPPPRSISAGSSSSPPTGRSSSTRARASTSSSRPTSQSRTFTPATSSPGRRA